MPTIREIAQDMRDELTALEADFASTMRTLENIGNRIKSAGQRIVSLHKQAGNEEQPNPETNATHPAEPSATTTVQTEGNAPGA